MKTFVRPTTLSTLAPLLLASAALAQEGEHPQEHAVGSIVPPAAQGLVPAIVTLVVFSLVLAVLAVKVWPIIAKGLADREGKIRQEIESAEQARRQATEALEQYQKSLADARAEAQKMIDATRAQQAGLAAELKAKSEIELNQLRERALKDIESAKRAAVQELYTHSTTLATQMASKILRRTISPSDTQQLVEESLSQLQTAAKG
jgi:F-type H+-transporting ATPase subunit b